MRNPGWGAAIGFLVLITSGCGGPRERSTTIPPARSAEKTTKRAAPAPRAHTPMPRQKPHLVPGEPWGRRFVAVSFERRGDRPGTEPVPHTRFSFSRERFAGRVRESIGWDDGCNGYGGFVRVRGSLMRVWSVAGTLVACMEVGADGKPHAERGPILMNFFGGTMRWRLHGGHLVISRGTQTLRLRETRGRSPQS